LIASEAGMGIYRQGFRHQAHATSRETEIDLFQYAFRGLPIT
jgi:hypothetical protein